MAAVNGVLIAECPGWRLVDRQRPSNGWIAVKLTATAKLSKRNWWLGWNGSRLARNRDAGLLAEHQRPIYEWVCESLASYVGQ